MIINYEDTLWTKNKRKERKKALPELRGGEGRGRESAEDGGKKKRGV